MNSYKKHKIVRIPAGISNSYLVINGEQSILIDAGDKKKENEIIDAVKKYKLKPGDIKLIILTHTHYDHCGSLKKLKEMTRAKIVVHKEEAECLRKGYCKISKGTLFYTKIYSFLGRIFAKVTAKYPAVTPDITISGKYDLKKYGINGFILPTPGHTKGSISVIINETDAIVGDTLMGISKKSVFPIFANNTKDLLKSWEKLINIGCEKFYPGHGAPFRIEKLMKSYEKEKRKFPDII